MKHKLLKTKTIWNSQINLDDWQDFIEEEYEGYTDETFLYERCYNMNLNYLEDEKCNLDKSLNNKIIIIADLGFWDGRRKGFKLLGSNLNEIFNISDWDEAHWYYDRFNVRCREPHHDGVNYYLFRELKDDKYQNILCEKIYNETLTSKDITRYTKSLVPYIKEIYGN